MRHGSAKITLDVYGDKWEDTDETTASFPIFIATVGLGVPRHAARLIRANAVTRQPQPVFRVKPLIRAGLSVDLGVWVAILTLAAMCGLAAQTEGAVVAHPYRTAFSVSHVSP
jgi:hypothetical protein